MLAANSRQALVGAGTLAAGRAAASLAPRRSAGPPLRRRGPDFLPWVVGWRCCSAAPCWCGRPAAAAFASWRKPSGDERGHWPGFVWVSAGILANAALITTMGFILSCALCFVLAVRGFKSAEGRLDLSPKASARRPRRRRGDLRTGVLDVHQVAGDQPARPDLHRAGFDDTPFVAALRPPEGAQSFLGRPGGRPDKWTSGTTCCRASSTAGTPINLMWALLGCTIGTAVGVLPGIGPAHRGGHAAADHAEGRPDRVDDLLRRHLLRGHVRRLDHLDPAQHAGRGRLDGHRARRQQDGQSTAAPARRWPPRRSAPSWPAPSPPCW